MKKVLIALSALCIVLQFACKSEDKKPAVDNRVRLDFQTGDQYEFVSSWRSEQTLSGTRSLVDQTNRYIVDVTQRDTTQTDMKVTIAAYRMNVEVPTAGLNLVIDTDKPLPPVKKADIRTDPSAFAAYIFQHIRGKSFTLKAGKQGDVLSLSGFNSILKNVMDSIGLDNEERMMAEVSFSDQFNDRLAQDQFNRILHHLPNQEIKPGDKWIVRSTHHIDFVTLNLLSTYKLLKEEDGKLKIQTESIVSKGSDVTETDFDVSGTETGMLLVDKETGMLISGEFEQNVKVKVEVGEIIVKGKGVVTGSKK